MRSLAIQHGANLPPDGDFDAVHLTVPADTPLEVDALLEAALARGLKVHAHLRLNVPGGKRGPERVNAFGVVDSRFWCPSQPATQDHFLAAVQAVDGHFAWASLLLEDLGFHGFSGGDFWGNICFCPACQYGLGAAGDILRQVAIEGGPAEHPSVSALLLWRRSVQFGLLRQMHELARAPLCLYTAASVRYTGPASVLSFEEAQGLAASCCVRVDEIERLRRLPRPLPVYAWMERGAELDGMFAGAIVSGKEPIPGKSEAS